jgi:hypothetical protein
MFLFAPAHTENPYRKHSQRIYADPHRLGLLEGIQSQVNVYD